MKTFAPKKFKDIPAISFTHFLLLKLPWAPSCMMLNPTAALKNPSVMHKVTFKKTFPVLKNTKCTYMRMNETAIMAAFMNNSELPVGPCPLDLKYSLVLFRSSLLKEFFPGTLNLGALINIVLVTTKKREPSFSEYKFTAFFFTVKVYLLSTLIARCSHLLFHKSNLVWSQCFE